MKPIRSRPVRTVFRFVLPFAAIPALVLYGALWAPPRQYAVISAAITALSVLLFFCGFETRKTGSRRLVMAAVFTALAVVGRFIPLVKPVAALIIFAGLWLGGEAGFLVGAMTAVISDFTFGQGPWTPFQMLSWGLIGLFAGLLSRPLLRSRALLALYGLAAGVLFSFVMDVWTVLWLDGSFVAEHYGAALLSAVPHTALYCVSNVLFLLLLRKPFGQKMDRVKLKYEL